MFPGFPTRLFNEVTQIYKKKINKESSRIKINVLVIIIQIKTYKDPERRKFNVFIGASFLANVMKDKERYWILKKDWDEVGPRVLDQIKDKLTI